MDFPDLFGWNLIAINLEIWHGQGSGDLENEEAQALLQELQIVPDSIQFRNTGRRLFHCFISSLVPRRAGQ